ncbi:hypothetical protein BO78DRAFT_414308 [Aspergillus sclerotiicarbonarius CBS 121057]|uniref:Glycosyltransferase 2-like domain-containing protein n=1 Tax=Aspergillus sclerotiicarbonarius (strain CBS 121057 / IBT 28362) TaxID=1448318 RepID=A0A319EMW5_ASPSB|nr:hypothetical protein BO78DRAFT_414308 [Aspergillus sclerotiicarbonarius CBS 121057]
MTTSPNSVVRQIHSNKRHSNRIYTVLEYNYIVFPITLGLLFYIFKKAIDVTGYYVSVFEDGWNRSAIVHAVLYGLFLLLQMPPCGNTLGLCLPMRPNKLSTHPKTRRLGTLYVCLVTKGANVQTVVNSVRCWDNLPQRDHPSVRYHVVLDSNDPGDLPSLLPSYVTIDQVPDVVPVKKARFKARALEHFQHKYRFSKEDWVLHLDEESEIDDRVMRTTFDFIERGTADFGMGTIYYTSTNHWKNAFLSAAEVSRLAEDFGRFQLPIRMFRRPLLGWIHGSWILINGEIENKIGWDTDNVCEDYWFGYHAAAQGFKFEWLHALVREQPPCTLTDLWNQRRRWYTGILSFDRIIVRLALISGLLGGLGTFMFPVIGMLGVRIAVPHWYRDFIIFNDAANLHVLLSSCILQDFNLTDLSWISRVWHAVMTCTLGPIVHFVHIMALLSTMLYPARGFVVIRKA